MELAETIKELEQKIEDLKWQLTENQSDCSMCRYIWHDLEKDPKDLPKGDEDDYEKGIHRKILLQDRHENIYTGSYYPEHGEKCFSVEFLEYGFQGNHFVAREQIQKWSEFPKKI